MLTRADIEFIKRTRAEITQNRTVSVILVHEGVQVGEDPLTGDPVYKAVEEPAEGTWKSITSQSGGEGELIFVNGILAETDDVITNLDISYDMSDVDYVIHGDTEIKYRIKARDEIGLGEINRHYILLKKVV